MFKAHANYEQYCQEAHTLPFNDYITYTQEHIKTVREQAKLPADKQTILMNSPFERRPDDFDGKKGVLLIHGYSASPYVMRSLGDFFVKRGFLVRAIVLPGHGSSPGELLKTKLRHWEQAVDYGIESLKQDVEDLYLCGFSLGGTLATLAAYQHEVKALFLMSPAFAITRFAVLLPPLSLLSQTRLFPGLAWTTKRKEDNLANYRSFTTYSAHQVQKAIKKLKHQWRQKPLMVPWYIAASVEDITVKIKPILNYFSKNLHPANRLRLYAREMKSYQGNKIEVIPSSTLDERITDMSHIAIPVSPMDPYFGHEGLYYGEVTPDTKFGEYSRRNLRQYHFYRLSYNPDFMGMCQSMQQFMDSI